MKKWIIYICKRTHDVIKYEADSSIKTKQRGMAGALSRDELRIIHRPAYIPALCALNG